MDIRNKLAEQLAYRIYFPFIKAIYKPSYDRISMEMLEALPKGSLGKSAANFMRQRDISLFHGYEVHDLKHVLLNIEMNIKGEILLEYFELGNGNRSIVAWIVAIFGTVLMPECFREYRREFARGKRAFALHKVKLQDFLSMPINEVRERLRC